MREYRREQAAYDRCASSMSGLQDALEAVDSRLEVGLSYDDYGNEIGNVVVVYNEADYDGQVSSVFRM